MKKGVDNLHLLNEGVSVRQVEIINLILKGMSNADIADELCISEKGVKTHLTGVYRKLKVKSRLQLVLKILL